MYKVLFVGLMLSVLTLQSPALADEPGEGKVGAVKSGVVGKVVETMDGGGYTYARLEKDGASAWVACPTTKVVVGQQLAFNGCTPMVNFESKALNRTFSMVMFCGLPLTGEAADLLAKKSTGSDIVIPEQKEKISVGQAKGENSHTVAECFDKKAELNNKKVVVKGKVVKVSSRIMGMNWLHLQDGTGAQLQKNNDLVVTTQDQPAVGDVVTVTGTLVTDKDFGSGYKYKVMVEQATVKK